MIPNFRIYDTVKRRMLHPSEFSIEIRYTGEISALENIPGAIWQAVGEGMRYLSMLSTGKSDKNGVELYDGDIVRPCVSLDLRAVIEYNKDEYFGSFMPHEKDGTWWHGAMPTTVEKIGDIHTTPELLEVKE